MTAKTALVVGVAQCRHHFALYEEVASGALGAKRLLVTLCTVVRRFVTSGVRKEATLRKRVFAFCQKRLLEDGGGGGDYQFAFTFTSEAVNVKVRLANSKHIARALF